MPKKKTQNEREIYFGTTITVYYRSFFAILPIDVVFSFQQKLPVSLKAMSYKEKFMKPSSVLQELVYACGTKKKAVKPFQKLF